MSEPLNAPVTTAARADEVVSTQDGGVDPAKVVTSVVQTVQDHPDVPASGAAGVITDILAGLYAAQPAIFAVSRAGTRTQAEVSLGLGLAQIIVGALLRRPA